MEQSGLLLLCCDFLIVSVISEVVLEKLIA